MARRRPAARPAARRSSSSPSRRGGGGNHGLPGWVWGVGGLALGAFAMTLFYLGHGGRKPPPAKPAAPPAHAAVKPVPVPPKQPSRFSFYHTLPNDEVVITPDEAKKAEKAQRSHKPLPADVAAPGAYFVQIGAYRSRHEADRDRAKAALLGIESHIQQVTLDANDIWYRVRVGPEPSLSKAQSIADRLHGNGMKAILIKAKS